MSSLNASSVAKCQQWRNDLLNSTFNAPLNVHEFLHEPVQRKFLAQRGLLEQLEQQAQQAQQGQHGQLAQAGQLGQAGQMGQLPGQQGFSGQRSLSGQQSLSGQNGRSGQNGLSGQNGFSGQNRFSGQNDFAGQNSLSGRSGFSALNGLSGQNGISAQNAFSGQNSLSGQQGISGQQGLLCQHGQPLIVNQPGQPGVQAQAGQPGQILALAPTVCCDQANCERATLEQLPEQYYQEPATPFTLMNPADGCDPQAGKKDPSEQYMFCPCSISRGQFITICCSGKDCDNSTKIDEVAMGPPEEKRAKTTLNQNQFKY